MSVYDKKLDPSIRNEVVTATLRMGHSMVPHDLSMMRPDKSVYRRIRIKDNFFQVIEEIANWVVLSGNKVSFLFLPDCQLLRRPAARHGVPSVWHVQGGGADSRPVRCGGPAGIHTNSIFILQKIIFFP